MKSKIAPITVRTIADLIEYDMVMGLHCLPCGRWVEADLQALVDSGKGGLPYAQAIFRCNQCGELASKQIKQRYG